MFLPERLHLVGRVKKTMPGLPHEAQILTGIVIDDERKVNPDFVDLRAVEQIAALSGAISG